MPTLLTAMTHGGIMEVHTKLALLRGSEMYPANWRKPQDKQTPQPRHRADKPGTAIQRAIAAYRNRSVLTVDGFLASLGADPDTIRRYRSSLGRKVAQAYRAATGQEPTRAGWAVAHRRLIPVYAYDRQQATLLTTVASSYKPTAHLLNGAS